MKRVTVLQVVSLLILSTLISSLQAQNRDRWKAGSAYDLSGNVLFLTCYISPPDNIWKKVEKDEMFNKLLEAELWLSTQASQFGVEIDFDNELLNNGEDIIFDTIEPGLGTGKERVDWVSRILKKLGYRNAKQAYRKINRKYNTDNIVVIIMANGVGRPYSMRYAKGLNKKKYFMEGAIVYNRYPNMAPIPVPAVVAHELLHIYGAWDLYATYAQTKERQQKAHELYPNDIMLRVDHNINSLSIGA